MVRFIYFVVDKGAKSNSVFVDNRANGIQQYFIQIHKHTGKFNLLTNEWNIEWRSESLEAVVTWPIVVSRKPSLLAHLKSARNQCWHCWPPDDRIKHWATNMGFKWDCKNSPWNLQQSVKITFHHYQHIHHWQNCWEPLLI